VLSESTWRSLSSGLRSAADAVLTIVFAPACASCGALLDEPSRGPVCARCWHSILAITPPVCDRCGDPLPAWRAISVPLERCPRCRRTPRAFDRARAIGEYEGALRAIVHALKYDGRRSLAKPLAAMMRRTAAELIAGVDCAVPVPLHPSRRRHRGFNQARDLANHLCVPVCGALKRSRRTRTQTGLPALQRRRNVRGAFELTAAGRKLRGAVVLLVDDVSTTGATLDACAQVLKAGGVKEVRALTAARVVTSPR
jgi:ComF family protein